MRLELTTSAWKANMLPLHQWRIRRTEARLKEGGIYITFILYQIFFQLSNFLKRTLAVLYRQCLLRSRGTCIAHYACRTFSRFSYPISRCRYSVRELVPHNPSRDSFWLVRWV